MTTPTVQSVADGGRLLVPVALDPLAGAALLAYEVGGIPVDAEVIAQLARSSLEIHPTAFVISCSGGSPG